MCLLPAFYLGAMFKQVVAKIIGKASATATTENELRVSAGGEMAMGGGVAADAVDTGNPTKIGGQARAAQPTAVAGGDRVDAYFDTMGRLINWPFSIRGLAGTASATLTNGTPATFIAAGGSGVTRDIVHISFANQSTAAASVELLMDGTHVKTVQVPASDTLSLDFTYPLLLTSANTVWTIDMEDITGTTVIADATYVRTT